MRGYLFAQMEAEALWRLHDLQGVVRVLGDGGEARPLTAASVALLAELQRAEADGVFDRTRKLTKPAPAVGSMVQVTGGKFSGFIGKLVRSEARNRGRVLLSIFGREGPVTLPMEMLESVAIAS